jgi:hypothetical protein
MIEGMAAVAHRIEAERLISGIAYPGDLDPSDLLRLALVHAQLATHVSNLQIAGAIDALRETVAEAGGQV